MLIFVCILRADTGTKARTLPYDPCPPVVICSPPTHHKSISSRKSAKRGGGIFLLLYDGIKVFFLFLFIDKMCILNLSRKKFIKRLIGFKRN